MRDPNVWTLYGLVRAVTESPVLREHNGSWVPARPEGFASIRNRLRAAWLVWTGHADAVVWPEDSGPNADAAAVSAQHGASDNSEQDQPKG